MDVRVGLWRRLSTEADAFELWCWRRLLRVPWTARRSNQSILKEISLGCSLEGLMLKLKLQYFGHLLGRANSFEKDPDGGNNWGQEEKGTTEDEMDGWHHWLNLGHGFGWTLGVGDGQGVLACCGSWGRKESDTTEWLNWLNWLMPWFITGAGEPMINKAWSLLWEDSQKSQWLNYLWFELTRGLRCKNKTVQRTDILIKLEESQKVSQNR